MKLAAALFAAFFALPAWARGDISHFVDKISCDSGPYALKLPETYDALRKIGPLKGEKLLREQDHGTYRARYRDLQFNGLRLNVVTYSNDPEKFQVVFAEIRSPHWKIAGPFRQGAALPVRVGDVETKTIRSSATVEFSGAEDTVRVRLVGRKVSSVTYLCVPD
ncbi:MAG: hypothetical protein JOZ85_15835 [Betaproteobacteria bacterium]|nr:hypothetical protein [Betaproteobacteria bacterium]